MATSRYLYNTIDAGCIQGSLSFSVGTTPIILRAIGLTGAQSVPIEVETSGRCATSSGPNCSTEVTHWGPLTRGGCTQALTALNTEMIVSIPGTYRINMAGVSAAQPVAIHLTEDTIIDGSRINYTYEMHVCPDGDGGAGCSVPPEVSYDHFQVLRCDLATGAPVSLLYRVTKANNSLCPPLPGGLISMTGYMNSAGVFVAATAPPAGLGACDSFRYLTSVQDVPPGTVLNIPNAGTLVGWTIQNRNSTTGTFRIGAAGQVLPLGPGETISSGSIGEYRGIPTEDLQVTSGDGIVRLVVLRRV